jgi:hypothetical protein
MRRSSGSVAFGISASKATKQTGFAALLLLVVLTMGSLYGLLVGLNDATAKLQRQREDRTAAALRQAKEALIAYAITYSDTHPDEVIGYLPCPDNGTHPQEGVTAFGACGAARVSYLGRLPWRTLGLGPLYDSDGECLWYAVSGTYKNNPKSGLMNWDTAGQFEVFGPDGVTLLAGSTVANRAVAVIIAPGAPRGAQNRTPTPNTSCGNDYGNAAAYLDAAAGKNNAVVSAAADAVSQFISATPSPGGTFTDRLIFITADEIWAAAKRRTDMQARLKALTERVAQCVAQAANTNAPGDLHLPWPAASNVSTLTNAYYDHDNLDDTAPLRAGRLPWFLASSGVAGGINDLFDLACMTATKDQNWYDNWKDHFLYVLADEFKPSAPPATACSGTCLTVDGAGNFAGMVLFGGHRLPGQQRDTAGNKDLFASYLEAPNAATFQTRYSTPSGTGVFNYQKPATSSYPEVAYCIQPNPSNTAQFASQCP